MNIRFENGIVFIGDLEEILIVLKSITVIEIDYMPLSLSDGEYRLKINGISVLSNRKRSFIAEIVNFILGAMK